MLTRNGLLQATYWVATEILTSFNHDQRVEIICRFIEVAEVHWRSDAARSQQQAHRCLTLVPCVGNARAAQL